MGETLFDQLLRGVAGAEARDRRLLAQFLELLGELLFDPLAGNLDEDLLGGRTRVLDADRVDKFLFLSCSAATAASFSAMTTSSLDSVLNRIWPAFKPTSDHVRRHGPSVGAAISIARYTGAAASFASPASYSTAKALQTGRAAIVDDGCGAGFSRSRQSTGSPKP